MSSLVNMASYAMLGFHCRDMNNGLYGCHAIAAQWADYGCGCGCGLFSICVYVLGSHGVFSIK